MLITSIYGFHADNLTIILVWYTDWGSQMEIVWYIIIGGLIIYTLIYLLRELAIVLLLSLRGRIVHAELNGVFGFVRFGLWYRSASYRYMAGQQAYQHIHTKSAFFQVKPPNTVELRYLPTLPSLARQQVGTLIRIGQILFYIFFIWIFAAVLTISPIINTLAIYILSVCIVVILIVLPKLTMHHILTYFFDPQIPKHAIEEKN